jgi:hypothetical protein
MAFVRNHTKTIEIPHEPGNRVTIRRPRRGQLADAANARQEKALQRVRALGGASFLAEMRTAQDASQPATDAPAPATVAGDAAPKEPTPAELAAAFDQDALLEAGIVSWFGPEYDGVEVTPDAIADLDPTTAAWIAEQIAEYATGKESARKNDSRSCAA